MALSRLQNEQICRTISGVLYLILQKAIATKQDLPVQSSITKHWPNLYQFTLNSVTDLYSFAAILSFIVPKSIGCFMIMEYPGAMASVTGKAKNPWGSFLKNRNTHFTIFCLGITFLLFFKQTCAMSVKECQRFFSRKKGACYVFLTFKERDSNAQPKTSHLSGNSPLQGHLKVACRWLHPRQWSMGLWQPWKNMLANSAHLLLREVKFRQLLKSSGAAAVW